MTNTTLKGNAAVGNPHVRFDVGCKALTVGVGAFCSLALMATEYPVDSETALADAITAHNGDATAEIVLAAKTYDLSKVTAAAKGHLEIKDLTLRGATGNPKDVVLLGNDTRRIVYGTRGVIRDLTISHGCARTGYETTVEGGGVCGAGDNKKFTIVSNVIATACSAQDGGAMSYVTGYEVTVVDNHAYNRGGGTFWGTYYDSIITNNLSENTGGGTFRGTYDHCRIVGNQAKSNGGGTWGGTVRNKSVLGYNECGGSGAGGFKAQVYSSDIVCNVIGKTLGTGTGSYCGAGLAGNNISDQSVASNCVVSGNAILTVNKNCQGAAGNLTTFRDCVIAHNYSPNLGGALQSCTVVGGVVSNNVSVGNYTIRGAFSLTDCNVYEATCNNIGAVRNCRFQNYTNGYVLAEGKNPYVSAGWYDGYENAFTGDCYLTNCLVAGYKVKNLMSPGDGKRIDAINCTFADNWAKNDMAASKGDTAEFTVNCARVINCIFARNRNQDGSAAQDFYTDSRDNTNVLFVCNVLTTPRRPDWKITESNTTVVADVKFDVSNATDPYSLMRKSPCREKGLVQGWMASATDVRHDPAYARLRDGKVDVGCYQCWLRKRGMVILVY